MANWFLEECAYCGTPTWCKSRNRGFPQCRACEVIAFFEWVLFPPLGYKLLEWQKRELRAIYGPCDADTYKRLIWEAYICLPKRQGKTFLASGLPIYHVLMEAEEVYNPIAVSAASARAQAKLIYESAEKMIRANTDLLDKLKPVASKYRFEKRDKNGYYQALSVDGKVNDGIGPSLVIKDEYHRWGTHKAEVLDAVLSKGLGDRGANRLEIKITTAGSIYESEIWAAEHERAKAQIRSRSERRYHAKIYQADPARIQREPDYWTTRESRVEANPSHEDNGGFILDESLELELAKALKNAKAKQDYLRLNLNVETTTAGLKAIDPTVWAACAKQNLPQSDSFWATRLSGRRVYGGFDMAFRHDLASHARIFPLDDGRLYIQTRSWTPKNEAERLSRLCHVSFEDFHNRGELSFCEGDTIRDADIINELTWACSEFEFVQCGYDIHLARPIADAMKDAGLDMVPVNQSYSEFAEPVVTLLAMLADGRIIHDGSDLEAWCADCLRLKADGSDHYKPAKPDRNKEKYRIDPIVAVLIAMFCWLRNEGGGESAWATGAAEVRAA